MEIRIGDYQLQSYEYGFSVYKCGISQDTGNPYMFNGHHFGKLIQALMYLMNVDLKMEDITQLSDIVAQLKTTAVELKALCDDINEHAIKKGDK